VKLELNDQERRAVNRSLAEREARLIENAEDTTHPRGTQRAASVDLSAMTVAASATRSVQQVYSAVSQREQQSSSCTTVL
jgi:hypothetical protein